MSDLLMVLMVGRGALAFVILIGNAIFQIDSSRPSGSSMVRGTVSAAVQPRVSALLQSCRTGNRPRISCTHCKYRCVQVSESVGAITMAQRV